MGKNSFRIAWRRLLKDRRSALLNLLCLSMGLACTLLIWLWVKDEKQVGRLNGKDDRLFQVMQNFSNPGGIETIDQTEGLLAKALADEMPEVEAAVATIHPGGLTSAKGIVSVGEQHMEGVDLCAGKDFFEVFSYKLIRGDKRTALSEKNSILLSDEMALKLFHTIDELIGKSVEWNQSGLSGLYRISGVFQKPPATSPETFDILLSYESFLEKNPKLKSWTNHDPATYLILKKGIDADRFSGKIAGFIKTKDPSSKATLFIQKYSDRYLYNHYENGAPSGGRIEYVRLFSLIALFILLIACINFMNLSTANATRRMKEIGIKKVIGASRANLVLQYLGETLLISCFSTLLALLIVALLLPSFNEITGKHLRFQLDASLIAYLSASTILTGLIAGSYPALYLSGFKPVAVLKGMLKNTPGEDRIRKGLVVFQFTLSVMAIVAVVVVYKQMQFIQTKNLGYNRDQILYFEKGGFVSEDKDYYKEGGPYQKNLESFLQSVKNSTGVVSVSNFRHNITNRHGGTSDLSWEGKDPDTHIDFTDIAAGYDFIETLGIRMVAGRTFSRAFGNERSKIIFNEAAIESMGLKDPIGKKVHLWGEDREIIGVAKNFHYESLHENLKPCFFDFTFNQRASKIMVKILAGAEKETIRRLAKLYGKTNPGLPFEYRFLDEDYQALYASEKRVASLSTWFAGIAILLSCLGLFSLASFTVRRRQKEMGIRKLAGATAGQLMRLLSAEFMKWILLAALLAFPISWWAMNEWLRGFAYRVKIGPEDFLVTAIPIFLITLFTISSQTIRAALENPIIALRNE